MRFNNSFILNLFNYFKLGKKIMDMPIVVIVGATGTGKSKLAIEIAKKFNGEIISADSMQVYKNLDIVTNKVTLEERKQVKHHLIDFIDPLSRFTVVDFKNRAIKVINDLVAKQTIPIIVGGTNYYIEAILWDILIHSDDCNDDSLVFDKNKKRIVENKMLYDGEITKETLFSHPIESDLLDNVTSEKLHAILEEIDPISANTYHPNDRRRIIRSLQIYQQHGKQFSELLANQHSQKGGCRVGGPLRYKNSCILWLQCDKKILEERLDERVDKMIEQGLIKELLNFHENYNKFRLKHNLEADYTKGIFQSIGFKEFHDYLILNETERTKADNKSLQKSIYEMKLATKRYAKRQEKWIINRFLKIKDREVPNVFALEATHLDKWDTLVMEPSFSIINHYLYKNTLNDDIKPLAKLHNHFENKPGKFFCSACNAVIFTSNNWNIHLTSKHHRKRAAKLKKKYNQLFSIIESHEKNLKRRNSI